MLARDQSGLGVRVLDATTAQTVAVLARDRRVSQIVVSSGVSPVAADGTASAACRGASAGVSRGATGGGSSTPAAGGVAGQAMSGALGSASVGSASGAAGAAAVSDRVYLTLLTPTYHATAPYPPGETLVELVAYEVGSWRELARRGGHLNLRLATAPW